MVTDIFAKDLAALARIDVIPTILEVVCRVTGMGFSAIARVTEDRWIACAVRDEIDFGLVPGGELQVRTTICDEVRQSGQLTVIDHVAEDELFRDHHTPRMYGFQSYISVPIRRPGGQFFGTLCAIDPRPARVNTPQTVGMFKLFADLIGFHLDAQDRLAASEAALLDARQTAELREQFVAVLGHDLRNPLASIDAGAAMLLRTPLDARATDVVRLIQKSVARMAGLIDDVLDLARGRLGGGIPVNRTTHANLRDVLAQVVAELGMSWPERVIEADFDLAGPVPCDSGRIAQLFSNLLANALIHGDPGGPVRVRARTEGEVFELSVANHGPPIPAEAAERLFQPFTRASVRSGEQGLGLGLYIASEIARAHAGTLDLASTADETRFTFRMPVTGSDLQRRSAGHPGDPAAPGGVRRIMSGTSAGGESGPHYSMTIIHCTPKRSATMPKRGEKKVLASGICTWPSSASDAKSRSASASFGTVIASEKPWKTGRSVEQPSDAITVVSPMRKLACMIFSSKPGGTMPGAGGSGFSLKRMNSVTSAPRAPR